ncbi:MAG: hypothetical protein ACR2PI_11500 [Hyphomicrobiaceae bacterium]
MITAIVRYRLPETIDREACRAHFESIAPGFQSVPGLLSKHFIWSAGGIAGGVYQWRSRADADAFYGGPWRDGIIARYGMAPDIEFFDVFCVTDNVAETVTALNTAKDGAA